ncbi:MAG: 4-alpha-glucanotransferase [Alphaproteobacteria bacterium]|nr:4-alpha-glucanotransferase [Alphaproteobacteria bacterium]
MNEKLQMLASKLGIATEYYNRFLSDTPYQTSEKTLRFFCNILGYKAETPTDIEASLEKINKKRWQKTLESVYVRENGNLYFDAVILTTDIESDYLLTLFHKGTKNKEDISYIVNISDETFGKYTKVIFEITTPLAIGYYDLKLKINTKEYTSTFAVAPKTCYQSPTVDNEKIWGYALQLYALRSKRNWGIGDFTDLLNFIKLCGKTGADVVGINPINVLNHSYPEEASPYMSMSRLFLNPIYIDVEKVPEFQKEDISSLKEQIKKLNADEYISYSDVYTIKIQVLEKLYSRMLQDKKRYQDFTDFCREKGADLQNLAAFLCLYEEESPKHWGGWHSWGKQFQNPNTIEVKKFCQANAERIEFFKFLQFEASRQLDMVFAEVKKQGLKIGLYRDLALGVGRDSAELWNDESVYYKYSGAGAPPDVFFPGGQKWNLGAFNPLELKERAYEPFIKILRAAMQGAGALRIDHVMSLMRLFIIPEAKEGEGTYIHYNFEDMLNIVAIESELNKCMIVGESIGTIPDGFLDKIQAKNIYSMSVLWAERWDNGYGEFKQPANYPQKVFTSVGTHDMAPLKAWWFGYDIETSYNLGLIKSEQDKQNAYHKRESDRWQLLHAMDCAGVWPQDNHRHGDYLYGEKYPEGLEEAVHTYLAKSSAKVCLIQLEDVFGVEKMQNLPGTDRDKHPNWRHKLPINIEEMATSLAYIRNIEAIRKERN